MSKYVKIQHGNYKLSVPDGNTITLDVGYNPALSQRGTVVITGNLEVQGTTTTVESQTTTIKDNILTLNTSTDVGSGTHAGILAALSYQSGIEISSRGTENNARLVLDDQYTSQGTPQPVQGIWRFIKSDNTMMGIQTNHINTNGQNLYLINSGTGYVTTTGVSNYERQVFDYSDYDASVGPIKIGADQNAIPNTKAVLDCISSAFTYQSASNITDYDTSVTVADFSTTGNPSTITFKVDNVLKAYMDGTGVTIDSVKIYGNTIASLNANNLLLSSVTTAIETSGWMLFDNQTSTPSAVAGGTYLYANATVGAGKTGLYIVNTTTSDELVSKKRALLFSMIF